MVGGDAKPLVRTARSGRRIIALDGCPLQCAAQILKRHGLQADKHYDLGKMRVKKKHHEEFDPQEAAKALRRIQDDIMPVAATESNALSSASGSSNAADNEPREPSSPVCYLHEFKDW